MPYQRRQMAGAITLYESQLELAVNAGLVHLTTERRLQRSPYSGRVLEEAGRAAAPLDNILRRRRHTQLGIEVDGAVDDGRSGVELLSE